MPTSQETLQALSAQLAQDLVEINRGLEERANKVQQLQNEIQQHLGARAYNQLLVAKLEQRLKELLPPSS